MIKELWILIKMLFHSKPSDVVGKGMEVVEMKHFPFKGYKAMSWCGRIIHRVGASEVNKITMNHERIHAMQAVMCNDSWVRYYLAYLWEYIRRGFLHPMTANYYVSKYESQAYANESDFDYCNKPYWEEIEKYSIPNAKKKWKELGGTADAWKKYIKSL